MIRLHVGVRLCMLLSGLIRLGLRLMRRGCVGSGGGPVRWCQLWYGLILYGQSMLGKQRYVSGMVCPGSVRLSEVWIRFSGVLRRCPVLQGGVR